MRAVYYRRFGGPEVIEVGTLPRCQAGPGEVLVRIRAAGINPIDWKIRDGMMRDYFPCAFPVIPGWDAAGTVAALGEGVTGFAEGDRVHGYIRKAGPVKDGTYADYIAAPAAMLAPIPEGLDFHQAAALPIAALTAWQALLGFSGVAPGQSVLVHAGAGGVGSIAVQVARHFGAKVVASASNANKGYVHELGASQVVDYRREDAWEMFARAAPKGYDLVLDSVGGKTLERSYALVRAGGAIACLNDAPDQAICQARGIRGQRIMVTPNGAQLRGIGRAIADGGLKPPPVTVMALKEAARAMEISKAGHVRGKLVLAVE
ncbi:MAG: NADP-dependent oxidoreductase [Pseudomonadota bacterium]